MVREKGEDEEGRRLFFEGKWQDDMTESKIVQVNRSQVYIIGGIYPSLMGRVYDVARSCLRVDLETGILEKMKDM